MAQDIKSQIEPLNAERILDENFPKGHKLRGKALVIYATSRLEGIKIGEQNIREEVKSINESILQRTHEEGFREGMHEQRLINEKEGE